MCDIVWYKRMLQVNEGKGGHEVTNCIGIMSILQNIKPNLLQFFAEAKNVVGNRADFPGGSGKRC